MKKHQFYLLIAIIIMAFLVIATYALTQSVVTGPVDSGCPGGCCTNTSRRGIESGNLLTLAKINNMYGEVI